MAENSTEVAAGGLVLAAALAFLVYAAQATGWSENPGTYALTASFRSVEGITVGTDVRLAGVKVGTVTDLSLNPQTFYADAVISLQEGVQLPDDSAVLISSEGLLGGNFVELVPGGSVTSLEPGAEIEDTQGAVSLITLMMKFVGGGSEDSAPSDTTP